jgi:hypothetical protein
LSEDGFREWAKSSSEETVCAGIVPGRKSSSVGRFRQGARSVSCGAGGKTVRLLVTLRPDLVAEPQSRSCAWSNLEPLKES